MPRVSQLQAAKNRETILDVSMQLFLKHGVDAVSVGDLMAAAGLTHGGFYGHFESKEALAKEACARAFGRSIERWERRRQNNSDQQAAFAEIVDTYLSAGHRDHAEHGCAVAALAGDVARQLPAEALQQTYIDGVNQLAAVLGELAPNGPKAGRALGLAQLSTLVGAVVRARATKGDAVSEQILSAARDFLSGAAAI